MQEASPSIRPAAINTVEVLRQVITAYDELPGLSFTLLQAQRYWRLDAAQCQGLLSALVDVGFLTHEGLRYRRAGR